VPRLDRVARHACRISTRNCRFIIGLQGPAEWEQHGRVAAYLAYVALGGDPETPAAFDWEHPELLQRTLHELRRLTLGDQSDFVDVHRRNSNRKSGVYNDALCWDAWRCAADELLTANESRTAPVQEYLGADDAAAALDLATAQSELLTTLEHALPPREYNWLVRRFCLGVGQQELADELIANTPRYQGPGGRERAINYINVVICRAKQHAREALGSRWAALADGMV
jgi:hypothetical protein